MKNRSGEKIKLASIDELLGVVNEESAMEIEISKIHPFKNHPFKVLDDEKMQDLVESVRINGVLTPVLLRMDDNEEYEMVSGHRRMHAAQLAGLTTIPAIVSLNLRPPYSKDRIHKATERIIEEQKEQSKDS